MTSDISISVIIPVFNGKPFLKLAVESALEAASDSTEILLVDDGSTDGGVEALRSLPVRIVRREDNRGIASAINLGIINARGKYITVLDADDLMSRNGLALRLGVVKDHPQFSGIAGIPEAIIDAQGKVLPQKHLLTQGYQLPSLLSLAFFKSGGLFPCLLWLFLLEKEKVVKVGGLDESLSSAFDCDLIFRLLSMGEIPVRPFPVVSRRWHGTNHSHQVSGKGRILNPTTQKEVIQVCQKYGIPVGTTFSLWEDGF